MKRNKGFTLIELLGVIIVLAIVALISMPLVLDAVSRSAKGAYEESLRNVISATDIYIASDAFTGMPDEGIEITSDVIQMKNKRFTSGIVFRNADGELELSNVSDGTYCGGGTLKHLVVIKSSCDTLDVSNPTLSIATNLVTSSAITVAATADDPESGIASYQYSKDNGATWTSKQTSSTYDFTGLTEDTTYDIKVKVYNNNVSYVLTTTKSLTVTTVDIPAPTYGVNTTDWSQSKTVTITYPDRQEGYVYEYSLDEASTWTEVAGPDTTKVLTFNANGNVIARVSDGTNIVSGTTYEVTNINTTPPVITVNPPLVNTYEGFAYTDVGVTASDDIEGDITSRIVKTGTVNINTPGTYTLTYNVTDNAGNTALAVIRNVNVLQSVYTFGYTGSVQSISLSPGTYKLEVWGAQGGTAHGIGGYGGYAVGTYTVTSDKTLYVYVGGQGSNSGFSIGWKYGGWNGGGGVHHNYSNSYYSATGGGATDIATVYSDMTTSAYRYVRTTASYNSRLIVAGGGGGGGSNSTGWIGGSGGGYIGVTVSDNGTGSGGTQSGPTSCSATDYPSSFGYGATKYYSSWGTGYCGGAGGGGYYGGCNNSTSCQAGGGGGGSGYVGGVSSSSTYGVTRSMYCYNCSGTSSDGIRTYSTSNVSSSAIANYAKSGHGYAKITYLGP